jgi:hypothetical protein
MVIATHNSHSPLLLFPTVNEVDAGSEEEEAGDTRSPVLSCPPLRDVGVWGCNPLFYYDAHHTYSDYRI